MEVKGFCLFKNFSLLEPGETDAQGTAGTREEFAGFNLFLKYVQNMHVCAAFHVL